MNERDKVLLKCLEALYSMVSVVAAALGEDMSKKEANAFERAHGKWNSAHIDLMHEMDGGADA